jgi:hypothetical protein
MASRCASGGRLLLCRWQTVLRTHQQRAGVATARLAGQRLRVRRAYRLRAFSAAHRTSISGGARRHRSSDWRICSCGHGGDSFAVGRIRAATRVAAIAGSVAGTHCNSRFSRCLRGSDRAGASFAKLQLECFPTLTVLLFALRSRFPLGSICCKRDCDEPSHPSFPGNGLD